MFLKTMVELTFLGGGGGGLMLRLTVASPRLHWFTVVFGPPSPQGCIFFPHSIYLSCFLGMQHPFSTAKQASMLASFSMTGFQHFDKDATVTSAVLGSFSSFFVVSPYDGYDRVSARG